MAAKKKASSPPSGLEVFQALQAKQQKRDFFLCKMPAGTVVAISYAAARRISDEEGAVQRVLNPRRIERIKNFVLGGGDFPSCIVLNWVRPDVPVKFAHGEITVQLGPRSAQIIDGQHRVAGLQAALNEDPSLSRIDIPISLYDGLDTPTCADIFLSINTEQKPVPRSLVFDLYGIAGDYQVDPAAARARDIAMSLNEEADSPYQGLVKLPGAKKVKGGIPLSSAVSALKPLVEPKGDFEQIGVYELEVQTKVVMNFFQALESKYGASWESRKNVFMFAAGFTGAVEFLQKKILSYCNTHKKNFTRKVMAQSIDLGPDSLVFQEEVRGLQGKAAPRLIYTRLVDAFEPERAGGTSVQV